MNTARINTLLITKAGGNMSVLHIILISAILILISLLGLSIRILTTKNGEFRGGSCSHSTPELRDKGITCACGDEENCGYEPVEKNNS